jgi:uncharacterized hydrophobic protein (TIGR00271 family)
VEYVTAALFVYSEAGEPFREPLRNNPFGASVDCLPYAEFHSDPASHAKAGDHLLIAAPLAQVKFLLEYAERCDISVGIIPLPQQGKLARYLDLPMEIETAMELALRRVEQPIDLVRCNDHIMLFKAVVGWVPALDAEEKIGFWHALSATLRKVVGMRLQRFRFGTASGRKVTTGASGCILTQHHMGDVVSSLTRDQSSLFDGSVGLVISSPFSIIEYLKFLFQVFLSGHGQYDRRALTSVGFIRSSSLTIEADEALPVLVDGHIKLNTPVSCSCTAAALRLNLGTRLLQLGVQGVSKEAVRVENLPRENEVGKLVGGRIPFFSSASEERFRELFMSLRTDSRIDGIYIVLMFLSTLLAAVGLFLDSAAVIIGAMLLAPLMTPIVSLAMGVLRGDGSLQKNSAVKIIVGVVIALLASACFSLLFPHKPVTGEMLARINPTLLDLAVAVLSGVAAAYAKSYREIIQNLAGVAIAVALVPPLAVAGIGIGNLDLNIFSQAFLLFLTNLTGIVLAATLTFRVLGFSPILKAKRGFLLISLSLIAIAVPLYLAYDRIVESYVFEQRIVKDRFILNGKYVVIRRAELGHYKERTLLRMDLLAGEPLNRDDLSVLKKKMQLYFEKDIVVQTTIRYVL